MSHIIALSQFFFFGVSTSHILYNQSSSLSHHLPIINFSTYFYTFSNFPLSFYLFISPLLSTLMSPFLYHLSSFYFWLFLYLSSYNKFAILSLSLSLFPIFWWILLVFLHLYFKLMTFFVSYNSTLG